MRTMFSSFMMAGYECNAALNAKGRFNDLKDTKHHKNCMPDYELIKALGITTVREGLLWNEIDKGNGIYDFSLFEELMRIAQHKGIQQIWDLNHFDYPIYLDPFSKDFVDAFARYAVECIKIIEKYQSNEIFIVPFNEISFFSFMGGAVGAWAPFKRDKGGLLKTQCVKAVIKAINEIKKHNKEIRFINVDPLMIRKGTNSKDIIQASLSYSFNHLISYETFDMISGKLHPEFGGSPNHLDIIGINHYPTSQEWEKYDQDYKVISTERMEWNDPAWTPLSRMLLNVASRYNRPIVLSETGAWGKLREAWWTEVLSQVDKTLELGIDLQGVCIYPVIDRRDWSDGHLTNSGLWDFAHDDDLCSRIPYKPAINIVQSYISKINNGPDNSSK